MDCVVEGDAKSSSSAAKILNQLTAKFSSEAGKVEDVRYLVELLPTILDLEVSEAAVGALTLIKSLAEKWSSPDANIAASDPIILAELVLNIFLLLRKPAYEFLYPVILESLSLLMVIFSTASKVKFVYTFAQILNITSDGLSLTDLECFYEIPYQHDAKESFVAEGKYCIILRSYRKHHRKISGKSNSASPLYGEALIFSFESTSDCAQLQVLTTRLISMVLARSKLFGFGVRSRFLHICLIQLLEGTCEVQTESLKALAAVVEAEQVSVYDLSKILRSIAESLRCRLLALAEESNSMPNNRFYRAAAELLRTLRTSYPAQQFAKNVNIFLDIILTGLEGYRINPRSFWLGLMEEMLKLYSYLLCQFPHVANKLQSFAPLLEVKDLRLVTIRSFRFAIWALCGKHANSAASTICLSSTSTAKRRRRIPQWPALPPPLRESNPDIGAYLSSLLRRLAGAALKSLESYRFLNLSQFPLRQPSHNVRRVYDLCGNSPSSLEAGLTQFDTAFRLHLSIPNGAFTQRLLRKLEEWMQIVCSVVSTKPEYAGLLPFSVKTLVGLVEAAFHVFPNHLMSPIMNPMVKLICTPWQRRSNDKKGATSKSKTNASDSSTGSFPLELKKSCLHLLAIIKLSATDAEARVFELALRDEELLRCYAYSLVPPFVCRIPNAKGGHRSQSVLKWLKHMCGAMTAPDAKEGVRCSISEAIGKLFCIYANPDCTLEHIVHVARYLDDQHDGGTRTSQTIVCRKCLATVAREEASLGLQRQGQTVVSPSKKTTTLPFLPAPNVFVPFDICASLVRYAMEKEGSARVKVALIPSLFRAFRHVDPAEMRRNKTALAQFCVATLTSRNRDVRTAASESISLLIVAGDGRAGGSDEADAQEDADDKAAASTRRRKKRSGMRRGKEERTAFRMRRRRRRQLPSPIETIFGPDDNGSSSSSSSSGGVKANEDFDGEEVNGNDEEDGQLERCVGHLIKQLDERCRALSTAADSSIAGDSKQASSSSSSSSSSISPTPPSFAVEERCPHHPEILETILVAVGTLGTAVKVDSGTAFSLLKILVNNMLHTSFDIRAVAFRQIGSISSAHNMTDAQVMGVHKRSLYLHLLESLPEHPMIVDETCRAFLGKSNVKRFIFEEALPEVIGLLIVRESEAALNMCAQMLDMSLENLTMEYQHQILSHVLTLKRQTQDRSCRFLQKMAGGTAFSLAEMVAGCLADLVEQLVWKLGSEYEESDNAKRGLAVVMELSDFQHPADARQGEARNTKPALRI
eukprot:jgi/Bigna1/84012/fgenesh1_pg.120_\